MATSEEALKMAEAAASVFGDKEIEPNIKANLLAWRDEKLAEAEDALKSLTDAHQNVAAKLAEQQQINEQLSRSLADTTGHVLTLCKALGRLMG